MSSREIANRESSPRRTDLFCETWDLDPPSIESEFCVVSTTAAGKDQRLLERDASLLTYATDTFADDFRRKHSPGSGLPSACLVIPVIVTNAALFTARYLPSDVSLETGVFQAPPKEVEPAEWVRFHKGFPSRSEVDVGDRTVFIVNASAFPTFLSLIAPSPIQPIHPKETSRVRFVRAR